MRPMYKRLPLLLQVATVATATVAAMFAAPAANAATSATTVRATKWIGGCEAILYSNSSAQAKATVYMSKSESTANSCTGWLNEQNSSTSAWDTVSGYHTIHTPGSSASTGWYDDSYAKRASACVEEETPYDVNAVCTAAW
jgi:hypothetical protein